MKTRKLDAPLVWKQIEDQLTPRTRCLDHVIPLARRGKNSYRNLVSGCTECNTQKGETAADDSLRTLCRQRRITSAELANRLRAPDALAAGDLRPVLPTPQPKFAVGAQTNPAFLQALPRWVLVLRPAHAQDWGAKKSGSEAAALRIILPTICGQTCKAMAISAVGGVQLHQGGTMPNRNTVVKTSVVALLIAVLYRYWLVTPVLQLPSVGCAALDL